MSSDIYSYYICRICGNEGDLLDIFRSEVTGSKVLLSEAFSYVTCLEVTEEDGCPKGVCEQCTKRLGDAYILKKQAKETYENFLDNNFKRSCDSQSTNASDDDERSTVKIEILPANQEEDELSGSSFVEGATDAVEFLSSESKLSAKDIPYLYPRKQKNQFTIEDKKHECQVCSKRFLRKSNLIDHLRLHANVKLFKCEFCDKAFVQSGNYKSHLRIHTNEKPFVCPICGKAYNQSSALRIHIRSHTNERNYTCDVCSKAFTNSSDLTKHKRVHDPSKQFKCQFCKKLFAQKANLKLHQNNIHRDELLDEQNT